MGTIAINPKPVQMIGSCGNEESAFRRFSVHGLVGVLSWPPMSNGVLLLFEPQTKTGAFLGPRVLPPLINSWIISMISLNMTRCIARSMTHIYSP